MFVSGAWTLNTGQTSASLKEPMDVEFAETGDTTLRCALSDLPGQEGIGGSRRTYLSKDMQCGHKRASMVRRTNDFESLQEVTRSEWRGGQLWNIAIFAFAALEVDRVFGIV